MTPFGLGSGLGLGLGAVVRVRLGHAGLGSLGRDGGVDVRRSGSGQHRAWLGIDARTNGTDQPGGLPKTRAQRIQAL